jgi:hypothetical protein
MDNESGSPLRAVVSLLLVAALIAGVWFVMHRLRESGRMQDCLASGRTNCAPLDTSAAPR